MSLDAIAKYINWYKTPNSQRNSVENTATARNHCMQYTLKWKPKNDTEEHVQKESPLTNCALHCIFHI